MLKLVEDREQFENFVSLAMPPLEAGEVYFVSLSARNKYLSQEEREYYGLGRTEMFGRTLVLEQSVSAWDKAMRELEGSLYAKRTRNGHFVPHKSLVVYVNINPSDAVQACAKFASDVNTQLTETLKATRRGNSPNLDSFTYGVNGLLRHFQQQSGYKRLLDVDVDTKEPYVKDAFVSGLQEHGVKHFVVETHGGFHVLVDREGLKKSKMQLHNVVKDMATQSNAEVVFNKNGMVPLPGTRHAGFLVRMV